MAGRVEHPDQKCNFHDVVERNKGKDNSSELVNNGECSEYNPVC